LTCFFLEVTVRKICDAVLIAMLGILLFESPVLASPPGTPSAPLGIVLAAENAHAGVDATYSGATIYDGDRLLTQDDGTMRVRFGTEQIFLHQNTSTLVHAMAHGFSADLDAGSISVSSSEGQTFQLLADGATIRPAGTDPTVAQISKISPTELILTSTHGALLVTMGDEVKTVESGATYKMEVETEDPAQNRQVPVPTARNHFILIAIAAVGVATGIVIWRSLVSPTSPSH
jgi:hypothetical protein